MSDILEIISKVRQLLGDNSKRGTDVFIYGSSTVFTLTESNVNDITSVYVNDTELTSGEFTFDTLTNKLTLVGSGIASVNDVIEIIYTYCPNYSDDEIEAYINAAISHLSANNYTTFLVESGDIYPDPEPREQNFIALVASILIDPKNVSYRLPDISVIIPTGSKSLSISDQIRKLIASYKKDSEAGAGIWAVL